MAYAELAGLPPNTGLYTRTMCLLAYAVFGPSRILVLGLDSSLGPMIAATVLPLVAAGGDPGRSSRSRRCRHAKGATERWSSMSRSPPPRWGHRLPEANDSSGAADLTGR